MNTAFWICFVVVFIAVAIVLVATGEASVAKTKLEALEHKYKLEIERKPKEVQVPVEKEVIKYVDRIIEKEVKVPVEKEVIKYVDRIVEKKVGNRFTPTFEEEERIINESKKKAEEIIFEAELNAEKIISDSNAICENERKNIIKKAEEEAELILKKANFEAQQVTSANKGNESVRYIDRVVEKRVEVPIEKEIIKYVDRIVEKEVQVPIEKEVVKYVDRIVEKEVKVPVEKEVIKYVDRIVEKEVERVVNPTLEEKERIIKEGQEAAENLIFEAELKAEKIVSDSKTSCENERKNIVQQAEEEANRIKEEAENEIRQQKEEVLAGEERNKKREEVLEHWSSELQRKESYNLTRSENHRKEALRLKHEAQDIRDDMLKQGSDYLAELRDRIGRLMEVIEIEDESLLDTISQELADKKKLHKQKIKKEAETFAEANFHDLPYDSMKICLIAVYYCDLLADKLIGNIHRTGVDNALEKVRQAIETTEALFPPSVKFRISDAYIQSKKEQIQLAFEIETYKKEQKEIRRQQLEAAREEIKAQKELEQERKKAEKDEMEAQAAIERNRFEMAQAKTQAEMDKYREQIARLEDALKQAQERRERALSMAQQTKCGYVYIISNIGSFGDGVYKIGMTRRVEPMERVAELGDASVPFPFDVHAMIYTEDAPGLEASLHRTFDDRKVNAVNGRKEFFRVPLSEIKQQVEQYGIACDWVDKPSASQYRDSIHLRK